MYSILVVQFSRVLWGKFGCHFPTWRLLHLRFRPCAWHYVRCKCTSTYGTVPSAMITALSLSARAFGAFFLYFSPVWAQGRCRMSPPRFLAECCKRQLNQGSFVLLYFRLYTFSDRYWVCLYFPVLFCLSVSVKWLAVKTACDMTYIVSSGALNSTLTNSCTLELADSAVLMLLAFSVLHSAAADVVAAAATS